MLETRKINSMNSSEIKFATWLDQHSNNSGYIYLDQSQNSFSTFLRINGAKRPDFLIFVKDLGNIFVDVKTSKLIKYSKFTISLRDFEKLLNTEEITRIPVHLAYPIDYWQEIWGHISISKVKKIAVDQQNLIKLGYEFIGIHIKELEKDFW